MTVNPRRVYRFTPDAEESEMRLDRFVASRTGEISRTLFRKLVDLGGVHVGGRRMRRCSHPVRAGETVEVHIDGLPLEPYAVDPGDVLYRDRYLLVLDKPAGVDTQPTPARYRGTLYEALLRYLQDPHRSRLRPDLGMVQRLDRDTSGAIAFSVHPRAHKGLAAAFTERRARKTYLALVEGVPGERAGEIRSLLARNRATNRVRSVARGGKEAITRYRVLEEFEGTSLVEADLLTGRSHQIRVHLSEAGHPLLGDVRYGGRSSWAGRDVPRQMLHAWRLGIPHPVTGENLEIEAPLPEDMAGLVAFLRRQGS